MASRILLITRQNVNLKNGSGFHVRNMAAYLGEMGYEFYTLHCPDGGWDMPPSLSERERIVHFIEGLKPDVVMADYSWMASVFDIVPDGIKKIIFVHDLRCRIVPCLTAIGYQDRQIWTEEKEAYYLQKADTLLVLNEDDEKVCKRLAPNVKTVRIGIAMDLNIHDAEKEVPGLCLYVGSRSVENDYALGWIKQNVWPLVMKEVPHATLMAFLGYTDKIHEHYSEAQLAVVPHIMQGGLKIKSAEAFSHSLPVIGNVCAFDGFPIPWGATDEPAEMASKIVQILTDEKKRNFERSVSIDICRNYMTSHKAYGNLQEELLCL